MLRVGTQSGRRTAWQPESHTLKAQSTHSHWREAKVNARTAVRTKHYIRGHLATVVSGKESAGFLRTADKKKDFTKPSGNKGDQWFPRSAFREPELLTLYI